MTPVGSLLLSSLLLVAPASAATSNEAGAAYGPPQPRANAGERGELEPIYSLLSLRLGIGPAFHPRQTPDKGLALDVRLGSVFLIPPILAIWPELGGSFEVRRGFERALGTVDLNIGLPAFLYYGVGFEGGVEGRSRLLGFRHGLDLRFFQIYGISVTHHVNHTPARGLAHDVWLMFSLDALAILPMAGSKATIFQVGERRLGGRGP